jgi:hypothetical protein
MHGNTNTAQQPRCVAPTHHGAASRMRCWTSTRVFTDLVSSTCSLPHAADSFSSCALAALSHPPSFATQRTQRRRPGSCPTACYGASCREAHMRQTNDACLRTVPRLGTRDGSHLTTCSPPPLSLSQAPPTRAPPPGPSDQTIRGSLPLPAGAPRVVARRPGFSRAMLKVALGKQPGTDNCVTLHVSTCSAQASKPVPHT